MNKVSLYQLDLLLFGFGSLFPLVFLVFLKGAPRQIKHLLSRSPFYHIICITLRSVAKIANRKKDKTLVRVTVCLEPHDCAKFETLAEEEGLSAAWFIRRAMRSFLDEKSVKNQIRA